MDAHIIAADFHGQILTLVEHQGQPYTAMKPIVEGMGMAWQAQLAKLSANKDRWGITEIVIPSNGGDQSTVCIPLRKLPGWMTSIHANKVRAEIRETVVAYQNECDDALWDYWTKGQATNPRTEPVAAPQLNGESEDERLTKLALSALLGNRFMTYFDDKGLTVMVPVKRGARVVVPEEIAGFIKEPGGVSLRLLPEIISACAERIGKANLLAA